MSRGSGGGEARMIGRRVWDLPVRLFHWVLVGLLVALWITGEQGALTWHMRLGQAVIVLVVFRIVWGFIGSDTARFTRFIKGPGAVIAYLRGRSAPSAGHNPLGALMVVALLAAVLGQALGGLVTTDDITENGPFNHLVSSSLASDVSSLHRRGIWLIVALAAIHIAANLFYTFVKKDNLIHPMVTGNKDLPATVPAPKMSSPLLALVVFLVLASAWIMLVRTYGR